MGIADTIKVNNGLNALLDEIVARTGKQPEEVLHVALVRYQHQLDDAYKLNSLISKLIDCRRLEHGEMVSDDEFAALLRVKH